MVLLLRSIKLLAKLFIVLFILSILLTCQSNYGKRKESGKCQIWRRAWKNKNMKYILVWTNTSEEFLILKTEQDVFIENRCKYTNCYVTRERKFSECNNVDIDAIIINRKNKPQDLPTRKRHPNQTFVYATQESSANYPICNDRYNNYFNMTWTYKLDSDIVWAYFIILDNNGSQVAPSRNVKWETYDKKLSNEAGRRIIKKKRNTAVWYVSNCYTQSKREKFVIRLAQALKVYGHGMHTMGDCGERKCPKENEEECMKILERYYFYLSLENSLAEDYVTEKVSKVLQHNTVPIVFGGANYSRFVTSPLHIAIYFFNGMSGR